MSSSLFPQRPEQVPGIPATDASRPSPATIAYLPTARRPTSPVRRPNGAVDGVRELLEVSRGTVVKRSEDVSSRELARFAREIRASGDPSDRLQRGIELAVDLVEGCDRAGVSLSSRGDVAVGAATDGTVERAGQLQQDLHEGPSLDVVRIGEDAGSHDLSRETRWERWAGPAVGELGLRAVLSLRLFTGTRTCGSLDLYADQVTVWSRSDIAVAQALATHLALAHVDAREIENRGRAMENRTVIGQAEGIVMERFNLTADDAFEVLQRVSQRDHVRLAVVAADLVRTARLPGSTGPARVPPPAA